jgi:hypothetical protein
VRSSASFPHSFLSVTSQVPYRPSCGRVVSSSGRALDRRLTAGVQGTVAIVSTAGNPDCHLILRGGGGKTNYDAASVEAAASVLGKAEVTVPPYPPRVCPGRTAARRGTPSLATTQRSGGRR